MIETPLPQELNAIDTAITRAECRGDSATVAIPVRHARWMYETATGGGDDESEFEQRLASIGIAIESAEKALNEGEIESATTALRRAWHAFETA
jgi:hypothetical protein